MEGWTVRTNEEGWSRREYILATEARIPVIKGTAMAFKLGILKIAELLWKPSKLKMAIARMRNGAGSSAGTYEPFNEEEEDLDKGEGPNATNEQVQILLKAIPRRIEALLDSAARTGVDTALQTVLTWYPKLKLEQ